jgi:hypothetical protein
MILQWDESFDIGSDTLTGVNDEDYKPPFPLTAKLNKSAGIAGRSPSSGTLQTGHGMPGSPHRQALG